MKWVQGGQQDLSGKFLKKITFASAGDLSSSQSLQLPSSSGSENDETAGTSLQLNYGLGLIFTEGLI